MVMQAEHQRRADQILNEIYSQLILYNNPDINLDVPIGGLADITFKHFNSKEKKVQQKFDELSSIVEEAAPHANECSTLTDNKNVVLFSKDNRGISFVKNEEYKGLFYQEIYCRRDLYLGYRLHTICVEREKEPVRAECVKREKKPLKTKGSADMGVYITNKENNIIFQISFNYKTDNRLTYLTLTKLLSKSAEKVIKHDARNLLLTFLQKLRINLNGVYDENLRRVMKNQDLIKEARHNLPISKTFEQETYEIRK